MAPSQRPDRRLGPLAHHLRTPKTIASASLRPGPPEPPPAIIPSGFASNSAIRPWSRTRPASNQCATGSRRRLHLPRGLDRTGFHHSTLARPLAHRIMRKGGANGYPPSPELFRRLSEKGEQLRRLHLMEPDGGRMAQLGPERPWRSLDGGDGRGVQRGQRRNAVAGGGAILYVREA